MVNGLLQASDQSYRKMSWQVTGEYRPNRTGEIFRKEEEMDCPQNKMKEDKEIKNIYMCKLNCGHSAEN